MRIQCLSFAALIAAPASAFAPTAVNARRSSVLRNERPQSGASGDDLRLQRTSYAPMSMDNGQVGNFGKIGGDFEDAAHTTGSVIDAKPASPSRKPPLSVSALVAGSSGTPLPPVDLKSTSPRRKPPMNLSALVSGSSGNPLPPVDLKSTSPRRKPPMSLSALVSGASAGSAPAAPPAPPSAVAAEQTPEPVAAEDSPVPPAEASFQTVDSQSPQAPVEPAEQPAPVRNVRDSRPKSYGLGGGKKPGKSMGSYQDNL
mmetsp:Transcript_7540/g.15488  ORF Transcript_7540/g.15488 Transcript_7540/m.15488 type:complete len:257 (+) Transcript_7540:46-816(+)